MTMTPVKIAAGLSATGIEGLRWVLVDDDEGGKQPPVPAEPAAAVEAEPRPRGRRRLPPWPAKLALVAVGLCLAWLTTRSLDGSPKPPAPTRPAPEAAPAPPPAPAGPVAALPALPEGDR